MKNLRTITLLLADMMFMGTWCHAMPLELPKFNYELLYDDVAMTAQFVDVIGERATKFQEYREVVSGPQASREILMAAIPGTTQYGYFQGFDLFRRDRSVFLEFGKLGRYKGSFDFNQIPHRFSENSRTIERDFAKGD